MCKDLCMCAVEREHLEEQVIELEGYVRDLTYNLWVMSGFYNERMPGAEDAYEAAQEALGRTPSKYTEFLR